MTFYELCLSIYILQNNFLFNLVLIQMKTYLLKCLNFISHKLSNVQTIVIEIRVKRKDQS